MYRLCKNIGKSSKILVERSLRLTKLLLFSGLSNSRLLYRLCSLRELQVKYSTKWEKLKYFSLAWLCVSPNRFHSILLTLYFKIDPALSVAGLTSCKKSWEIFKEIEDRSVKSKQCQFRVSLESSDRFRSTLCSISHMSGATLSTTCHAARKNKWDI